MIRKTFLALIISMFAFTGTVLAHGEEVGVQKEDIEKGRSGLLPGDLFYFMDLFSEGLGTLFTFGNSAKAKRYMSIAEERLSEAKELAELGEFELADKAMKKYQKDVEKALKKINDAKIDHEEDIDEVLPNIAIATIKHQAVLADVYDRVPEEAKKEIEDTMKKSMIGYEVAIAAMSKDIQEEAKEEIEKISDEIDNELSEMKGGGKNFPKMRIGHLKNIEDMIDIDKIMKDMDKFDDMKDMDKWFDFDSMEENDDGVSIDGLDIEDFGEDDFKELDNIGKEIEKEVEGIGI